MPTEPHEVGSTRWLRPAWEHGLIFVSPYEDVRVHIGGQSQLDTGWFLTAEQLRPSTPGSLTVDPRDSLQMRRGRLRIDGTMYDFIDWAAEYDFVGDVTSTAYLGQPPGSIASTPAPGVTDLYVSFRNLPLWQNFRLGNFKEPIGLEHLTSSRWLNFMERSFNQDAFYGPFNNGFSPGAMLYGWLPNEVMTWAAWIGPNTTNPFGYHVGSGDYAYTSRLTLLPFCDGGGRYLWHLGASYSFRMPDEGQLQVRARGPVRSGPPGPLNPVYAQTGSLLADNQQLLNLESALVWGPWLLQGEYLFGQLTGVQPNPAAPPIPEQAALAGGSVLTHGGYVEALWFLTGEHREYNRQTAVFERVVPLQNAYFTRTPAGNVLTRGAWQLGVRYSGLNLNDSGLNGGILNSMTVGLNWFINPQLKYQFNYDVTDRSAVAQTGAGKIYSFGLRMALDF